MRNERSAMHCVTALVVMSLASVGLLPILAQGERQPPLSLVPQMCVFATQAVAGVLCTELGRENHWIGPVGSCAYFMASQQAMGGLAIHANATDGAPYASYVASWAVYGTTTIISAYIFIRRATRYARSGAPAHAVPMGSAVGLGV